MTKQKKIFVLDTNVILHDFNSIYNFEENDIVIPIVVLEELDKFKKGNNTVNYHARQFMRELDKLSSENVLNEGLPLGKGKGKLFIETGKKFSQTIKESFMENNADHKILATADYLSNTKKDSKVILVTQDINLRMKGRAIGVESEDYETGKIANVELIYRGIHTYDNFDNELISKLYSDNNINIEEAKFDQKLTPNEYFILKNSKSSVLAYYNPFEKIISRVDKHRTYGITPKNAEQTFAIDALLRKDIKLITITGKAGTGKTLLALSAALEQRKNYHQIFLARPIVPLANRDLGFLPGDAKEKITPYMQPLFDNLTVIKQNVGYNSKDSERIDNMLKEDKLLISPLAYIRGRSLPNVFFIIDEAQNLTPHEVKTIITRAGEGTKMIFTGDIEQIDSPYLDIKSNGLSYLTDKMKGQDIFAHINLKKGERSYLAELASNLL